MWEISIWNLTFNDPRIRFDISGVDHETKIPVDNGGASSLSKKSGFNFTGAVKSSETPSAYKVTQHRR